MKREGFPKNIRIKKESEFKQTFLLGAKKRGENLIVFHLLREDESGPKFGIKVGRGIKKAVIRNRIKRAVREVLRRNKERFGKNENVVVLCKSTTADMNLPNLRRELENLIPQ